MEAAKLEIVENQPLAALTTFGVGGSSRYFATVRSRGEALDAVEFARFRGLPLFVLGGGSNVLISDEGFQGLTVLNRIRGIEDRTVGEFRLVSAGAGEDWQEFADRSVSAGLQGIECLTGIPGTVGASPVQNIGAYGQEVSESVEEVEALEIETGKSAVFNRDECSFGYRKSVFNSACAGKYLITRVTYRLKERGKPSVLYGELQNRLEGCGEATLGQVRDGVLAIRDAKGLLVRPGRDCFRCAGSFFKNPTVAAWQVKEIEQQVCEAGAGGRWAWPLDSGEMKVSAARLIQSAGFCRGYRRGNAGLSPRHTLVIVAYEGAAAREVISLAEEVQEKVLEKFGILLRPEVRLLGFPPSCLAPERQSQSPFAR